MEINKIGLAVTFSPNGKALLLEAKRLSALFNAKLILIHIGEKTDDLEKSLEQLIIESGIEPGKREIFWRVGEPAKSILKVCREEKVDLLIAGALEKEHGLKYYIGSIARKIMRQAECSVLIKVSPRVPPVPYSRFCVTAEYSKEGEDTIKTAFRFAQLEHAEEFILIKEFQVPGLATTVYDSGTIEETENSRQGWQYEEEEKLRLYSEELNLKDLNVKTVCIYGREGVESGSYIEKVNGDLLVLTGPKEKLNFLDRIFQHDIEFLFESIPCDLLILKPKKD